jgi:hypothetical protein
MVLEPQLHQIEKDLFTGEIRIVEDGRLSGPITSKFLSHPLREKREEEQLFLSLLAKEVKLRVIEDLPFRVFLIGVPSVN